MEYRHQLEENSFKEIARKNELLYLKLHEPDYTPKSRFTDVIFFKGKNTFFYFPLSLVRFIIRQQPDIVFIHSFIFPVQILIILAGLSRRTKFVVQHHAEKPFRNRIKRFFQKLTYRRMDAYLFTSAGLAESFLKEGIIKDPVKIHEVMEGSGTFGITDKDLAREKLGLKKTKTFLWVGRLNENKDPMCALMAFEKLSRTRKDFMFYMIYGSVELENEIKHFISNNNLTENIKLVGQIPHPELETWYNASDYFVSASHYEAGGIAFCEALSCACVPVVTNIPSFQYMTDNGKCGYLFEPGNSDQLFEKLAQTFQSDYRSEREKVIEKFNRDLSYEAIGRKIERIFNDLLK